jgi:hypothetical protein
MHAIKKHEFLTPCFFAVILILNKLHCVSAFVSIYRRTASAASV